MAEVTRMIAEPSPPSPEDALRIVVEGTSRVVGQEYFRALVRHLADALGYAYSFVGVFEPGECARVRTLALWTGAGFGQNFVYDLAGTPCENVAGNQICSYPRDVQRRFPSDHMLVEMNVHSYLGAPIVSDDRPLGLVVVLDVAPKVECAHAPWLLRICAARAAAELERLDAEEALRQSEARFSFAVAGSSDGLWDWDCRTDEVFYSARFRELLGYASPSSFPGTLASWRAHVHPEDREACWSAIQGHLERRAPYDIEYRLRTRAGDYRWFRARGQAEWDARGEPVRMAGSITDVTDRVVASAERERLIGELERKNAELERFVYTVSHELKSPLVTIEGFVGHLRGDLEAGHERQVGADLQHITMAVTRMQKLLDGVSTLARVGRIIGEIERLDMDALVDEACELVRGGAALGDVELAVTRPLPPAYGDRVRVFEVLQNLLENAIKFSRDAPRRRVEVGGSVDGAQVRFHVRDHGRGVDPAYHERIFALFEQLDRAIEGTGIGLAVVKRIVEFHGGRIWCESPGEGAGATFYFTLPATRPQEAR